MTPNHLSEEIKQIKADALASIYYAKSGHPGGVLSSIDLIYYIFKNEINIEESDEYRNRFILSKGHSCPGLYSVFAHLGIITRADVFNLRKLGSNTQGHTHRGTIKWVEASTGSLGQGFSFGIGEAMGLNHQGKQGRVYVMIGDGELQEGEIWEGAMCAGHYKLNNLCIIIDYNKMQSDDYNKNIMTVEPLAEKWKAFNWHVIEIDGHDFTEMEKAFVEARTIQNKPTVIIAHTIKGKGISFMEGSPAWHGSVRLSQEDFQTALKDLGCNNEMIKQYNND